MEELTQIWDYDDEGNIINFNGDETRVTIPRKIDGIDIIRIVVC